MFSNPLVSLSLPPGSHREGGRGCGAINFARPEFKLSGITKEVVPGILFTSDILVEGGNPHTMDWRETFLPDFTKRGGLNMVLARNPMSQALPLQNWWILNTKKSDCAEAQDCHKSLQRDHTHGLKTTTGITKVIPPGSYREDDQGIPPCSHWEGCQGIPPCSHWEGCQGNPSLLPLGGLPR